jgi:hypothetical protein
MPVSPAARGAVRRVARGMELFVVPVAGVVAYLAITSRKRADAAAAVTATPGGTGADAPRV